MEIVLHLFRHHIAHFGATGRDEGSRRPQPVAQTPKSKHLDLYNINSACGRQTAPRMRKISTGSAEKLQSLLKIQSEQGPRAEERMTGLPTETDSHLSSQGNSESFVERHTDDALEREPLEFLPRSCPPGAYDECQELDAFREELINGLPPSCRPLADKLSVPSESKGLEEFNAPSAAPIESLRRSYADQAPPVEPPAENSAANVEPTGVEPTGGGSGIHGIPTAAYEPPSLNDFRQARLVLDLIRPCLHPEMHSYLAKSIARRRPDAPIKLDIQARAIIAERIESFMQSVDAFVSKHGNTNFTRSQDKDLHLIKKRLAECAPVLLKQTRDSCRFHINVIEATRGKDADRLARSVEALQTLIKTDLSGLQAKGNLAARALEH